MIYFRSLLILKHSLDTAQHTMTIMESDQVKKGGHLTISLHSEDKKDGIRYWVLSVKDTGVGIHPDQIKTIFSPFHTTKKETSGTGLGLAVSEKNVNCHKGFINVHSTVGEGSTFSIYLPVADHETNP